jgi:hypothetical protein
MRTRIWLALIPVLLLVGCSGTPTPSAGRATAPTPPQSAETSVGASVPSDDPTLPRADADGNTPEDVLLAYIRAWNRAEWKTAYSLTAPPKGSYASWAKVGWDDAVPWDDFKMYETRIVEPNKALVRVTYSKIGFSALEGLAPEDNRRLGVVREPGEWWVLEKGIEDDGVWKVAHKEPYD